MITLIVTTGSAVAIPDNDSDGVVSTIAVPSGLRALSKVRVTIGQLSHTWVGDLSISLVSPAGAVVPLVTADNAKSANDYTGTLDSWGLSIDADVVPVQVPVQPLAQTVGGCAKPPAAVRLSRTTVLLKARCRTNAGQSVSVSVTKLAGKRSQYKVIRAKNGKVSVLVTARRVSVRVVWSASATANYSAFSAARVYRT
ncbi:MAG: proprotein convertase P-domain-containing protein [Actinomycetes bacterium]